MQKYVAFMRFDAKLGLTSRNFMQIRANFCDFMQNSVDFSDFMQNSVELLLVSPGSAPGSAPDSPRDSGRGVASLVRFIS